MPESLKAFYLYYNKPTFKSDIQIVFTLFSAETGISVKPRCSKSLDMKSRQEIQMQTIQLHTCKILKQPSKKYFS